VNDYSPAYLWNFLFVGYLFTIAIETPILLIGLAARHSLKTRLIAGVWLTACTYPIVVLVLPLLFQEVDLAAAITSMPVLPMTERAAYLLVAETFAPVAECALFWAAFGTREEWGRRSMWRDFAAIVAANLASFGLGEWVYFMGWF